MSERVAVIGAGNWGVTLAHVMASNGHTVRLWTRNAQQAAQINELRTSRATPELHIAPGVLATTGLEAAVTGAALVLVAVPSQAFREVSRKLGDVLSPEQLVLHGSKGLEMGTHRRLTELLLEETCARQIGVLSGPNIAAEVGRGKPAGAVVATAFPRLLALGRRLLSSARLRVFSSTDVAGVEICGALKNVVAIAAGIADEMQVGDNAQAFLITQGLAEQMRLASAMGAEPLTLTGLAGIGDLMVTCRSPLSRNHRIGAALARGERLDEAIERLGMVAEGVYASRSARALAERYSIEMPLFARVDRVLHEGLAPAAALEELMSLRTGRDVPRL